MMRLMLVLLLVSTISLVFSIKLVGIEFRGLETVPEASLTEVIKPYLNEEVSLDLIGSVKKAVLELGYFKDARADLEDVKDGMKLILTLKENPVLEGWTVKIDGPGLIEKEELEKRVKLEKGVAFNSKRAYETLVEIKKAYEESGYFLVEVNGNLKDGIYEIEVSEYAIWDMVFRGDTVGLDATELKERLDLPLLKDYYGMKPLFRLFVDKKRYYPNVKSVQALMYRLSEMVYFSRDTRIDFEKIDVEGVEDKTVDLIVYVKQSEVVPADVPVRELKLNGVKLLDERELQKNLSWILKDRVSNFEILKSAQYVIDEYSKKGYPMVWVIPSYENGVLKLDVREKYISDVRFEGLQITKEYLVKDLVSFDVGEPLERSKIAQTYGNLNRSEYFESVDILPVGDKESTEIELLVKFKEKEKKFQFVGGLAWAPPKDEDWWMGFSGQLNLKSVNPQGYGQTFSLSLNLGFETKSITFNYSVPRPFVQPFRFDGRVYYSHTFQSTETEETEVSTTTDSIGTWLDISSLPFWNNTAFFGVGYEWKSVNGEPNNTLKFRLGHSFDNRDSVSNPRSGLRIKEILERAGLLGLDSEDYTKLILQADLYGPIWNGFFWALEAYGGGIDLKRGDEKITLAYSNAIRGYPVLKGLFGYKVSTQLKYTMVEDPVPINALIFYDFGGVSDELEDLSGETLYSYGAGIEFSIPALANVEFGYGYRSKYDSWDFYFLLGAEF